MPLTKLSVITDLAEELKNLRSEKSSVKALRRNSVEIVIDPDELEIRTKVSIATVLAGMDAMEKAIVDQLKLHNIEA